MGGENVVGGSGGIKIVMQKRINSDPRLKFVKPGLVIKCFLLGVG